VWKWVNWLRRTHDGSTILALFFSFFFFLSLLSAFFFSPLYRMSVFPLLSPLSCLVPLNLDRFRYQKLPGVLKEVVASDSSGGGGCSNVLASHLFTCSRYGICLPSSSKSTRRERLYCTYQSIKRCKKLHRSP